MSENLPEKLEHTPEGLPVKWSPLENVADFAVQSSLPTLTVEDRAKVLSMIEGDVTKGSDVINSKFSIRDYIAHPVEIVDPETSEVTDAVRILLITGDGIVIAFVSLGILKSMQRLVWQLGRQPPFDPPVWVTLKQQSTRGARRTFKLVPVTE